MFTGIVEETGWISKIKKSDLSMIFFINGKTVLENTKSGDSISINGVCLTITTLSADGFYADIMYETLEKSSLGTLKEGDMVNLERAMPAYGRFGGHIVSGHIDGTGYIQSMIKVGNSIILTISTSRNITELIVKKGSIAIDGISLTVTEVSYESFKTSIIPHTQKNTCLLHKKTGDIVNLENDIIGKYIKNFLNQREAITNNSNNINMEFLNKCGF